MLRILGINLVNKISGFVINLVHKRFLLVASFGNHGGCFNGCRTEFQQLLNAVCLMHILSDKFDVEIIDSLQLSGKIVDLLILCRNLRLHEFDHFTFQRRIGFDWSILVTTICGLGNRIRNFGIRLVNGRIRFVANFVINLVSKRWGRDVRGCLAHIGKRVDLPGEVLFVYVVFADIISPLQKFAGFAKLVKTIAHYPSGNVQLSREFVNAGEIHVAYFSMKRGDKVEHQIFRIPNP